MFGLDSNEALWLERDALLSFVFRWQNKWAGFTRSIPTLIVLLFFSLMEILSFREMILKEPLYVAVKLDLIVS